MPRFERRLDPLVWGNADQEQDDPRLPRRISSFHCGHDVLAAIPHKLRITSTKKLSAEQNPHPPVQRRTTQI